MQHNDSGMRSLEPQRPLPCSAAPPHCPLQAPACGLHLAPALVLQGAPVTVQRCVDLVPIGPVLAGICPAFVTAGCTPLSVQQLSGPLEVAAGTTCPPGWSQPLCLAGHGQRGCATHPLSAASPRGIPCAGASCPLTAGVCVHCDAGGEGEPTLCLAGSQAPCTLTYQVRGPLPQLPQPQTRARLGDALNTPRPLLPHSCHRVQVPPPSCPAARWPRWEPQPTPTAPAGRASRGAASQSRCALRRASREQARAARPACSAAGCRQPPRVVPLQAPTACLPPPPPACLPAVGGSCLWGSVVVLPVNSLWSCPATCAERGHSAIAVQSGRALCRKRLPSGQTLLGGRVCAAGTGG